MSITLQKLNEVKKNHKITFLIKGSDEVFANTIRRLILEEVPTLAVEDVEIKDNNSALYDEMLALRLGLTPIKTDLKSYKLPENEDEVTEKSARCTLQLKLKVARKGYVYAKDASSSDPKCTFVYEDMPLTKLIAKQKVEVIMTAVMGTGKDHAKWAPGLAHYRHEGIVKVGKIANPTALMQKCSDKVFEFKNNTISVNDDAVHQSNLLDFYASLDKNIDLTYTNNIVFSLEGWGQLTTKEILEESCKILIGKTEQFTELLK